jgi:hypothetical protein
MRKYVQKKQRENYQKRMTKLFIPEIERSFDMQKAHTRNTHACRNHDNVD